jgi:hypothetical protein
MIGHKALECAVPGDVIVVDAGGDLSNAIIGELMAAYAAKKGVAGIVINGCSTLCNPGRNSLRRLDRWPTGDPLETPKD